MRHQALGADFRSTEGTRSGRPISQVKLCGSPRLNRSDATFKFLARIRMAIRVLSKYLQRVI
jgi:hypothetical protein